MPKTWKKKGEEDLARLQPDTDPLRLMCGRKWGWYLPCFRVNHDQSPCEFFVGLKYTYDEKGKKHIAIRQPGDGAHKKRFCTLHIIFRPCGAGEAGAGQFGAPPARCVCVVPARCGAQHAALSRVSFM
jgi:hypothetical protein